MIKLRWTTQAVEDMEAVWQFIPNDSDAYADLVVARLLESVERLEHFPRSGRIVPELSDPNLREIIEPPYRIVYRINDAAVEILAVFRASSLLPSPLGDQNKQYKTVRETWSGVRVRALLGAMAELGLHGLDRVTVRGGQLSKGSTG